MLADPTDRALLLLFFEPGLDKLQGFLVIWFAGVVGEGGLYWDPAELYHISLQIYFIYLQIISANMSVLLRKSIILASRKTLLLAIILNN